MFVLVIDVLVFLNEIEDYLKFLVWAQINNVCSFFCCGADQKMEVLLSALLGGEIADDRHLDILTHRSPAGVSDHEEVLFYLIRCVDF